MFTKISVVEHAKVATWIVHELEVLGILSTCNIHILQIYTFRRSSCFFFFAWRLLEWLRSCDRLKMGQLKAHLFIQTKTKQLTTLIFVINSSVFPLVLHILNFIKNCFFFIIWNFRCIFFFRTHWSFWLTCISNVSLCNGESVWPAGWAAGRVPNFKHQPSFIH